MWIRAKTSIFATSDKYPLRWCPRKPGGNVTIQSRKLCRLGATLIAWIYPPGDESWCAMEWLFRPTAVVAMSAAMLLPPPAVAGTPPSAVADLLQLASTQVVNFALESSFCPQHGLYGIAHVSVDGTSGMTADQNFIWTTQKAATSIHSVPREGAVANVTIVYHCNVQVLWWLEPGAAHKVTAALWVNGSGEQPSYVIGPDRPTPPSPSPSQAPQPTPSSSPSQTAQPSPSPSQTAQPTLPPAPSQTAQPTPSQHNASRRHPRRQPSQRPRRQPSPRFRRRPHRQPSRRLRRQPSQRPRKQPSRRPSPRLRSHPRRQPNRRPLSRPGQRPEPGLPARIHCW